MNEMFKAMAERMAQKIKMARIFSKKYTNKRECPFVSELIGMEQALKTMGINYEFEYDFTSTDDYECITSVTVMGNKAVV